MKALAATPREIASWAFCSLNKAAVRLVPLASDGFQHRLIYAHLVAQPQALVRRRLLVAALLTLGTGVCS